MQRFRLMNIYVALVLLMVLLTIGGVTWLRRLDIAATADAKPLLAGNAATAPNDATAPHPGDAAQHVTVSIDNFNFTPKALSVAIGATVTWVNHDDVPHTATSDDQPAAFDSRALDTDDRYSFTFTKPGTYRYYCKVHPHMTAMVVVK
jgi:plastocyanin